MGRSSLLGIDRADLEPDGRDTAALGPGDTSDSGSDMAGAENIDNTDPTAPLDVALADDMQRTYAPVDSLHSAPSDASGTGERRSAGSDAGLREAADISVDRVFDPATEGDVFDDGLEEDEDPDLAFVDRAEAGAVLEDEDAAEGGDDDVEIADQMTADDAAVALDGQPDADDADDDAVESDVEGDGQGRTAGDADGGVEGGSSEDDPDSDVERAGTDRDVQQGGPRGATRR